MHYFLHLHLLPFFVVLIALEAAWLMLRRRAYPWREVAATFGVVALQLIARAAQPLLLAGALRTLWAHRLFTIGIPLAASAASAFLLVELAYYWSHRCSHRWGWLWATHSVHHSSEHMTLATAVRLGVSNVVSGEWLFYTPLILLGFPPTVVFGLLSLNLAYQFFLHTELVPALGPLEWVLNTPAHHRVHHASNHELLDRNFGGVLIVFDRLFGTLAAECRDIPLRYGLAGERRGDNPLWIAFGGWVGLLRSWRARLLRREPRLAGEPLDSAAA